MVNPINMNKIYQFRPIYYNTSTKKATRVHCFCTQKKHLLFITLVLYMYMCTGGAFSSFFVISLIVCSLDSTTG